MSGNNILKLLNIIIKLIDNNENIDEILDLFLKLDNVYIDKFLDLFLKLDNVCIDKLLFIFKNVKDKNSIKSVIKMIDKLSTDNNLSMVVARYNENIDWVKKYKNVIVYNKGDSTNLESSQIPFNTLDNVGREGHTFIYHIINNYNNLSNWTVFVQGNPFDHCPNFYEKIDKLYENNNNLEINNDFNFLSDTIYNSNISNCPYHSGIPLKNVYNQIFNTEEEEKPIIFSPGAQFYVSKKLILTKPKIYYEKILKLLDYNINPIEGFCIERLWKYIFEN
jgi:hypothetical protein